MSPEVRSVLDAIDTILAQPSNVQGPSPDARALWDILTALRGPDSENTDLKLETTCVIRRAAFPKTAATSMTSGQLLASFGAPETEFSVLETAAWKGEGHFLLHAINAAGALGIYPLFPR